MLKTADDPSSGVHDGAPDASETPGAALPNGETVAPAPLASLAPLDTPERLDMLAAVESSLGPGREVLDRVARLIAQITGAPIAAVTLVHPHVQHFIGLVAPDDWNGGRRDTPITHSLCQHVVGRGDVLEVADATRDPLLATNGAVQALHVRAYLGVPLVTPNGVTLGACCAMDLAPHAWRSSDRAAVEDLASVAMAELQRGVVEHRLSAALDAVQDGVWEWDMVTRRSFVSHQWNRMHGLPPDHPPPTADEWRDAIHRDDVAAVEDALGAHARGETPGYECEYRVRHTDGRWRWMLGRGRIVSRAPDGRPLRMLGTLTDVTERREAMVTLERREAYFRRVLDALPVGVSIADVSGRTVFENARLHEIWAGKDDVRGTGKDERHTSRWPATGPVAQRVESAMSRALTRGERCTGERLEIERVDGEHAVVLHHAAPLYDETGAMVGAVTAVTDVTRQERDVAEHTSALRASEERYALAARATRDVIWDWTLDPLAITISDAMLPVFGYDPRQVPETVGWWIAQTHPEDRKRVLAGLGDFMERERGDDVWQDSFRFRRHDGEYAIVELRAIAVRDASGKATRLIGAMRDVTVTRRLEEQLRHSQKLDAIGQLAGGVAHDFNNVLTVIVGGVQVAEQGLQRAGNVDASVTTALSEVRLAAARAASLVRKLLTVSRRQPAHESEVNLARVIRDTERLLRRVLGEEVFLNVSVHAEDVAVLADAGEVEQILLNLAGNARDAMLTPQHGHLGHGGTLSISLDLQVISESADADRARRAPGIESLKPGRYARLVVADTGHGMEPDVLAHIFEPFFTTKSVGRGTGLGMAMVYGIVESLNGAIHVDSAPGAGTRVTIFLPVCESSPLVVSPPSPAPRVALPLTVLLVEDDAWVRRVGRMILERQGVTVIEAVDGLDAIEKWPAISSSVRLVVTDVRMPRLGGFELARRLRAGGEQLPIVFMSGYSEEEWRPTEWGRAAFLAKPFTAESIAEAVDQLMREPVAG